MSKRTFPQSIRRWLIRVIGLGVLTSTLGYFLTFYLEREISERISVLKGHVAEVHVKLFSRSIQLCSLHWASAEEGIQVYPPSFELKNVKVQGISLLALLFNQRLVVQHLELDSGSINYNTQHHQSTTSSDSSILRFLRINKVTVRSIQFFIQEDSLITFAGHVRGEMSRLILERDSVHAPRFSVQEANLVLDTFQYMPTGGDYMTTIQRIAINTQKRQLILDSILLIPLYGKYEFASRLGQQRARLNLSAPQIVVNGWMWEKLREKSFKATSLHINSLDLYSFKDKRLPFLRTSVVPLPMETFAKLAWAVKIDSLISRNSTITIETYPEEGRASGILSFNQLNTIMTGLNNRWKKGEARNAHLYANALLMNTGVIQAQFQFPQDGSTVYTAKGTISKMELTTLNEVIGNMANLRITSGYLQDLTFAFQYTEYESRGSLDMAYQDLHILGLDKNKSSTHEIKTLLIRVFTPRDKHKSVPLSKAVGVIDIQRNRQKFVFNIWWKSILDGIQSSITGNRMPSKR